MHLMYPEIGSGHILKIRILTVKNGHGLLVGMSVHVVPKPRQKFGTWVGVVEQLLSSTSEMSNNFLDNFSVNEENFEKIINNMHEMINKHFIMDEKLLKSKRNRIANPWITSYLVSLPP